MASAAANRYARALVDILLSPSAPIKPEDAISQLRDIEQTIDTSLELRNALLTPAIQTSSKHAVIAQLAGRLEVSTLIRNFLYVIIDRRRIGILAEIREAVELLLDERTGVVQAQVISAAPLDQRRSAELESGLARLTGKRMRLRFTEDPELIGGIVARIGSTIYDGSIRGQLQQMRRQLAESSAE